MIRVVPARSEAVPRPWNPKIASELKETEMRWIAVIALVLVIVGALNWGLWAVAEVDLVAELFGGSTEPMSKVVYALVGLAGLFVVSLLPRSFNDN